MQTCSGPLVHWQGSPKISWHNLLYPLNSPSTKSQWLPWTLASLLTGVKKIVCLQLLAPNKEFVYYPRSTKPSLTRAYLSSQKLQFYLRDVSKKKQRENVGIFPTSGTPPPCLGMTRLFEKKNHGLFCILGGVSHVKNSKNGSGIRVDPPFF